MKNTPDAYSDDAGATPLPRDQQKFKKLQRPIHATKRSSAPARLRGIHRRRRKRMDW